MTKYNLVFLFYLFSFKSLHSTLPEDLTKYIKSLPKISETITNEFTLGQNKKITDQMVDILEELFAKSIKIKNYQRNELYRAVRDHYESSESMQLSNRSSPQPFWASKDAIVKLSEAYQGKQRDGILTLTYKDQDIPFVVSEEYGVLAFKILGAPLTKQDHDYCLHFTINPPIEASLEWLGPGRTACPIVAKSPGNFLLTMVEDFAKTLGIRAIELKDRSSVRCRENNEPVNFRTLRFFQTGKGWYESKGYFPRSNQKDRYSLELNDFIKHSLSAITKEVEQKINESDSRKVIFQTAVKEYKQLKNSDSFSEFMKWLYDKNCADYLKVYGLVVEDNKFLKVPFNLFLVKSVP